MNKNKIISFLLMFILSITTFCFRVNAYADTKPKTITLSFVTGVVNSVETVDKNVFLLITVKGEARAFYVDKSSVLADQILNFKKNTSITIKYVSARPIKYKELTAMPINDFDFGSKPNKIIGVDNASGTVKKVETIDDTVFIVITSNGEDRAFYINKDSDIAKLVLGCKPSDIVNIKYALGTPKKYGELAASPLSNMSVTKNGTKTILKPVIGTGNITGKVKKIIKTKDTIFLLVTLNNKSNRMFYISIKSPLTSKVLNLKINSNVTVKYTLGSPKKYGLQSAFPLADVSGIAVKINNKVNK